MFLERLRSGTKMLRADGCKRIVNEISVQHHSISSTQACVSRSLEEVLVGSAARVLGRLALLLAVVGVSALVRVWVEAELARVLEALLWVLRRSSSVAGLYL
jgi:hypothetical protein